MQFRAYGIVANNRSRNRRTGMHRRPAYDRNPSNLSLCFSYRKYWRFRTVAGGRQRCGLPRSVWQSDRLRIRSKGYVLESRMLEPRHARGVRYVEYRGDHLGFNKPLKRCWGSARLLEQNSVIAEHHCSKDTQRRYQPRHYAHRPTVWLTDYYKLQSMSRVKGRHCAGLPTEDAHTIVMSTFEIPKSACRVRGRKHSVLVEIEAAHFFRLFVRSGNER